MEKVAFLSQAYHIDLRIDSKLEQVQRLKALATKASATLVDDPVSGSHDPQRREEIICKIVDLQAEINADIDRLVDLKRELRETIEGIPNAEYRTLLELRYINFRKWEEIAVAMGYTPRNVRYIHERAIEYLEGKSM